MILLDGWGGGANLKHLKVRALQAEAAKLSDQIAAIDESIGQVGNDANVVVSFLYLLFFSFYAGEEWLLFRRRGN